MEAAHLPPRFDPHDPGLHDDPYPVYARLREAGPLCRGGPAQWVVTRYDEVAALLSDPRLGAELPEAYHRLSAGPGPAGDFVQRIMLYKDRPAHVRLRRLMGQGFSPGAVRRLRGRIGELADGLLAPALEAGRMDAAEDLALPLPIMVVCELIGIPPGDRAEVRPRAFDLGRAIAASGDPAGREAADRAVVWLRDYIGGLLAERRVKPRDDLLSRLLSAQEGDDRLTAGEIVDNVVFLFFAGFETTTSLLGTGCAALLGHPGVLDRLRDDPGLVPTAVEEFLRHDAPIQSRVRLVREPVTVGGRTLRPGRMLLLLIGSANRDERRFPDPDRLDPARSPNPHVSFGGGPHFCLGAALARAEGEIVFTRLARRVADIAPAGPPVRSPGPLRAFTRLPVALRPA
ncbi:cytochrome P450 [Bailinhaonella thermotolerans]|uniref:Cytochrome P450 n=1 Tax=Bailinhaonella thermotolerans TaxID=1070861 RepID=A0A3A4AZZ7_9ACTN|nr:cytochrome P450 [Bailinhaonella thermotolerans]RJL27218.1 cytochrome P450 [Bailinhaonella thermotolerans]